ncbi:MAG TPA: hypothetical protein VHE61_00755 [Opitutaceae bacterium]|nr:hypothetical protein [Opitutaceae bacterium]
MHRLILATLFSGVLCWLSAKSQPWSFIEAVGGIRILAPVRHDGRLDLPVECNVSGLKAITRTPTLINSALVIRTIRCGSRGHEVWISVVTCLAGGGRAAGGIHYADLSDLKAGAYVVYYGDAGDTTHKLGSVVVP